jgi:hypothetical protein
VRFGVKASVGAALVLVALGAAAPIPTSAQVVAGPPTAASVTIYRDRSVDAAALDELEPEQGLALISETRFVEIPAAGRQRIAFRGVADTMVPQTVALTGLPGVLVERNEDFDLLTPGALVAHSTGREVKVVQTGPGKAPVVERTAVVRWAPGGVVLDFDGKVEALGCGGPPTRLVFDRAPPELSDKPTFSVLADVPKPGRYAVRLSYLATGFSWSADYVAHVRPDGRTLDLEGWLTLANKTAAGFAHAPTDVVAGELARDADTRPVSPNVTSLRSTCWGQRIQRFQNAPLTPALARRMAAPAPPGQLEEMVVSARKLATQGDLGDYKLYTLPEPTEVAAHQTKQVAFLDLRAVPFSKVYVSRFEAYDTRGDQAPAPPEIVLRLKNRKDAGLGKPLPSGTVAVMETAGGALALAGEQKINDVAVGLPLELHLGRAMDIAVIPRVTAITRQDHVQRTTVDVSVENDKPQAIVLEHRQSTGAQDFKLVSASAPSTLDKGDRVWTFRLGPGQKATLTYVMSERD